MILDRFLVTDRAAVVTGAGRGIGAATAVALAEAGADVLISARTESQLTDVAKQIEATGRRAVVVAADLSDLDAAAGLAAAAHEAFGRLDVVVNNVGGSMPREFAKTAPRHMEDAFHFNVSTAHALTRAAVPLMLDGSGAPAAASAASAGASAGAIVNISSVMGRVSGRGYLAYGTAKAALSHYTRLAARDLAPRIRVNAIGVGSVATSALDIVLTDDTLRTTMEQATPLRRIGDPDDIAATVLFLVSDAGAYVTGKVIGADGGLDQPNLDLGFPDL
jgi:7-alpha-hydroxysteroid dehydrogenase